MGMEKIKSLAIIALSLALVVVSFCRGCENSSQGEPQQPQKIVVCDTVRDTVTVTVPGVVERLILRHDTITVTDTAGVTVAVSVPIEQKHYSDTLFDAWVSGVVPNLDSLRIYPVSVNTHTVEYLYRDTKPKRWGVSVSAGAAYTPKGFQPFLGVGVSYTLFQW